MMLDEHAGVKAYHMFLAQQHLEDTQERRKIWITAWNTAWDVAHRGIESIIKKHLSVDQA